jgi:phosphoribosylpyrophosphate synthetase/nicotinamidase-related amidase
MAVELDAKKTLHLTIDGQGAFGAKALSPNLQGLRDSENDEIAASTNVARAVYQRGGHIVATKDWHNPAGTEVEPGVVDNRCADEEKIYGVHGTPGTSDVELDAAREAFFREAEAANGRRTVIAIDKYDTTAQAGQSRLVELHKNVFDVAVIDYIGEARTKHPGFIKIMQDAEAAGLDTVIVDGKIAEVCVLAALNSLREQYPQFRLVLLEDGVSSLPAAVAKQIGLPSKEEVVAGLPAEGIIVARSNGLRWIDSQALHAIGAGIQASVGKHGPAMVVAGSAAAMSAMYVAQGMGVDVTPSVFQTFATGDYWTAIAGSPKGKSVTVVQSEQGASDPQTLAIESLHLAFSALSHGARDVRVVMPSSMDPQRNPSDFARLFAKLAKATGVAEVVYSDALGTTPVNVTASVAAKAGSSSGNTVVLAGKANPQLAARYAATEGAQLANGTFDPKGRNAIVVQSTLQDPIVKDRVSGPALFIDALLMAQAAAEGGAKNVRMVLPYMAWGRSDHAINDGTNVAGAYAGLVGAWAKAVGVNDMVLVTPHNVGTPKIFAEQGLKVRVVDGIEDLAAAAQKLVGATPLIRATPDAGAALRFPGADVRGEKHRKGHDDNAVIDRMDGTELVRGKPVFIADDEIASGKTILQALKRIGAGGPSDMIVGIVHNNLPRDPEARAAFFRSAKECGATKFLVCDTQPMGPLPADLKAFVHVMPIGL